MTTAQPSATAQALQKYLQALTSGDLDSVRSHFAENATWTIHGNLPLSGTYHGADAIITFLATAMGDLFLPGTQRFTFGKIFADGATAVLQWRVTGTGTATDRPYDNDYCGVFIITDGLIQHVQEYFDTDHVRQVLYPHDRAHTVNTD